MKLHSEIVLINNIISWFLWEDVSTGLLFRIGNKNVLKDVSVIFKIVYGWYTFFAVVYMYS